MSRVKSVIASAVPLPTPSAPALTLVATSSLNAQAPEKDDDDLNSPLSSDIREVQGGSKKGGKGKVLKEEGEATSPRPKVGVSQEGGSKKTSTLTSSISSATPSQSGKIYLMYIRNVFKN
jgi:hypothetical protein